MILLILMAIIGGVVGSLQKTSPLHYKSPTTLFTRGIFIGVIVWFFLNLVLVHSLPTKNKDIKIVYKSEKTVLAVDEYNHQPTITINVLKHINSKQLMNEDTYYLHTLDSIVVLPYSVDVYEGDSITVYPVVHKTIKVYSNPNIVAELGADEVRKHMVISMDHYKALPPEFRKENQKKFILPKTGN